MGGGEGSEGFQPASIRCMCLHLLELPLLLPRAGTKSS